MTMTINIMSSNTIIAVNGSNNKIVHLGKDQRPISVMILATMEKPTWMTRVLFNRLSKGMSGQIQNYTMAGLVTVELLISTESAMEVAKATGDKLRKELFMIENLEGSHLGKKNLSHQKYKWTVEDLSCFKFLCNFTQR